MRKMFACADWHWDHANILFYTKRFAFMSQREIKETKEAAGSGRKRVKYSRDTVERMNTAIIDDCNSKAGPEDVIWNLGDVLFGPNDPDAFYGRLMELRSRINCKNLNLVLGNHDKKLDVRSPRKYRSLSEDQIHNVFNEVHSKVMIQTFQGQYILCDHTMHCIWEGNHKGIWHLYGHSHTNAEGIREEWLPNAKMLDVGIDNAARLGLGYTMFDVSNGSWLKGFMDNKKGQAIDCVR